jgi:hypothetical protein
MRCSSCAEDGLRPACEECGGIGFVPTGLTTTMLSRLVGQAAELADLGQSIHRLAREGSARKRSGQGHNGH